MLPKVHVAYCQFFNVFYISNFKELFFILKQPDYFNGKLKGFTAVKITSFL